MYSQLAGRLFQRKFLDCAIKRLCGYNMGEGRNSSYGGGAGGGAQKTFYGPYDMVYWLSDLPAP